MNVSQLILATKIIVAAGLLGCAPIPVEGRYSYDTATDFSKFESFALAEVDEGVFSTPESTAHFRKAMVRALSAKGFTENSENPDFRIFAAPVHSYIEVYALAGNLEIPKAMLRVSFFTNPSEVNIYEGAAYAYYEDSWSQEHKDSTVDEAVRVILEQFPPGK